jgi:hypothetical protein
MDLREIMRMGKNRNWLKAESNAAVAISGSVIGISNSSFTMINSSIYLDCECEQSLP